MKRIPGFYKAISNQLPLWHLQGVSDVEKLSFLVYAYRAVNNRLRKDCDLFLPTIIKETLRYLLLLFIEQLL